MAEATDFLEKRQFERYPLMLESKVSVGQTVLDRNLSTTLRQ